MPGSITSGSATISSHGSRGDTGLGWLFLFLLAAIAVYDAAGPRFLPGQKELQAFFLFSTILIAYGVTILTRLGRVGRLEFLGISILALFLIPVPLQTMIEIRWVIGDYLLLAAPFGVLALIRLSPGLLRGRQMDFLILVLAITAAVAPLFSDPSQQGRFEAPSILLLSFAWVAFFYSRNAMVRTLVAVSLFLLLVLTWYSTIRGYLIAFLLLPFVVALMTRRPWRNIAAVSILVAIFAGGLVLSGSWIQDRLSGSRFSTLAKGGVESDDSLMFRLVEGKDVLSSMMNEWGPVNVILGGGLGASFKADAVYAVMTERYAQGNVVSGRVHNVHLGPLLIFFRFGVLGLAIFIWFCWIVCRDVLSLVGSGARENQMLAVTVSATLMNLMLFNLYNVTNMPLFPVSLGLYLAARERLFGNRYMQDGITNQKRWR